MADLHSGSTVTSIERQIVHVCLYQHNSTAGKQAQQFSHDILLTFDLVYQYMLMPFVVIAHNSTVAAGDMHDVKLCGCTKQCACSI